MWYQTYMYVKDDFNRPSSLSPREMWKCTSFRLNWLRLQGENRKSTFCWISQNQELSDRFYSRFWNLFTKEFLFTVVKYEEILISVLEFSIIRIPWSFRLYGHLQALLPKVILKLNSKMVLVCFLVKLSFVQREQIPVEEVCLLDFQNWKCSSNSFREITMEKDPFGD